MCLIQHFYKTTASLVFSKGIFNAWRKKVGEKKKLPFSIFAKKRNGALPVKTSCITTSMLCTLLQKSQSGHKQIYPSNQITHLCFSGKLFFFCFAFAEKVPLHFGIDFWAGWNNTMTPNSVQKTLYFCLLYLSETILSLFVT